MTTPNLNEQKEVLLTLVRDVLAQDQTLRETHQIGEKFRFIRDRLAALVTKVEEALKTIAVDQSSQTLTLEEDEILVYIYLYNAQGLVFQTWQKMLNPAVFYEYSVNRPAYLQKEHIDEFIRGKTNKAQHAYLIIAVKKDAVLQQDQMKDAMEHPLVKVKEGALKFHRFFSFMHNEHEYGVNGGGVIVKKGV